MLHAGHDGHGAVRHRSPPALLRRSRVPERAAARRRHGRTALDDPAFAGAAGALDGTFNDGLLPIDADLVEERHYTGLLALLAPETWHGTDTPHTRQFLHNRYVAGRQTLIGSTYNYLLATAAVHMKARTGLAPADARVLHFNVAVKPWMTAAMLGWTDPGRGVPDLSFKLWYDAYVDCLASAHLRARRRVGGDRMTA